MILKNVLIQQLNVVSQNTGWSYGNAAAEAAIDNYNKRADRGSMGYGEVRSHLYSRMMAKKPMRDTMREEMQIQVERSGLRTVKLRIVDDAIFGDVILLDSYHGRIIQNLLPNGYPEYKKDPELRVQFAMRSVIDGSGLVEPEVKQFTIIAIDAIHGPVQEPTSSLKDMLQGL